MSKTEQEEPNKTIEEDYLLLQGKFSEMEELYKDSIGRGQYEKVQRK